MYTGFSGFCMCFNQPGQFSGKCGQNLLEESDETRTLIRTRTSLNVTVATWMDDPNRLVKMRMSQSILQA